MKQDNNLEPDLAWRFSECKLSQEDVIMCSLRVQVPTNVGAPVGGSVLSLFIKEANFLKVLTRICSVFSKLLIDIW